MQVDENESKKWRKICYAIQCNQVYYWKGWDECLSEWAGSGFLSQNNSSNFHSWSILDPNISNQLLRWGKLGFLLTFWKLGKERYIGAAETFTGTGTSTKAISSEQLPSKSDMTPPLNIPKQVLMIQKYSKNIALSHSHTRLTLSRTKIWKKSKESWMNSSFHFKLTLFASFDSNSFPFRLSTFVNFVSLWSFCDAPELANLCAVTHKRLRCDMNLRFS